MSEPQGEYRIHPLVRCARIYDFPSQHDGLTFEQREEMRIEQALSELRRKARLEANRPKPWYKRLSKWYADNYERVFEGTGVSIIFLIGLILMLFVLKGVGDMTGWWGW